MRLFDLHCDTITGLETVQLDLGSCEAAIDLNKIEKSGFDAYAQCFAMFLSDEYRGEKALRQCGGFSLQKFSEGKREKKGKRQWM